MIEEVHTISCCSYRKHKSGSLLYRSQCTATTTKTFTTWYLFVHSDTRYKQFLIKKADRGYWCGRSLQDATTEQSLICSRTRAHCTLNRPTHAHIYTATVAACHRVHTMQSVYLLTAINSDRGHRAQRLVTFTLDGNSATLSDWSTHHCSPSVRQLSVCPSHTACSRPPFQG